MILPPGCPISMNTWVGTNAARTGSAKARASTAYSTAELRQL